MKAKCECCELEIHYDERRGKPANVVVLPAVSLRAAYVQKAIHRGDGGILPLTCRGECAGRCAGALIIAKFQPSGK